MQTETKPNGYPAAVPCRQGLFDKAAEAAAPAVRMISIHDLVCEDGTRLERDECHINALADDFRQRLRDRPHEHPVQTPLRVIRRGDKYPIVAGNNRYLAGLRTTLWELPCIVMSGEMDEAALLIEMAKDNELREGYTPLERARNILRVVQLRKCTRAEAGRLLGIKTASEVTKLLAVLNDFPSDLHPFIGDGDGMIPVTTAYTLSRLKDPAKIADLAEKVRKGLLTRERAVEVVDGELSRGKGGKVKEPTAKGKTAGGMVYGFTGTPEGMLKEAERLATGLKELIARKYDLAMLKGVLKGMEVSGLTAKK